MAYLELSKEAFDDLIRAAGSRAGQVANVCNTQGVFETTPAEEESEVAEPEVAPEVEEPSLADSERLDEVTEAQSEEAPLDDEITDD